MTIEENKELKDLTTFRIGGPARFFVRVTSGQELTDALDFAREKNLPLFILGGGSNILVSDEGFSGLVIKIEIGGIEIKDVPEDSTIQEVIVGAGVVWDELVGYVVEKNLYGLENLSYIPGTVGAAPVQNIGAYGTEARETIAWVETVNGATGEIKVFTNAECQFAYRDSFFKKTEGKNYVVTRVAFHLKKQGIVNTSYKDLAEYIKSNNLTDVDLGMVRDMVVAIRKHKLPDVKEVGTAGSFFKNPIISRELSAHLHQEFPLLPEYEVDAERVKVSAAWMLDNLCGMKGHVDGAVAIHERQALVIVNKNNATAQEIKNLAQKMINCVKEKTSITLEQEVLYI
jgi:UDP-N-acetylmuramate dehydrogenase